MAYHIGNGIKMHSVQLKISNLPSNMNQASLAQVFSPLEGVTSVRLLRDANNIITGYVDFLDQKTADLVKLVYHGWSGFGQPLHVDYSSNIMDVTNKRGRDEYDSQATTQHAKQARGMDSMVYHRQANGAITGMQQQQVQVQQLTQGPVSGYNNTGMSGYPVATSMGTSSYPIQQQQQQAPTPVQQAMSGYMPAPGSMAGNGSGGMTNGVQQMVQMNAMATNGNAMMQPGAAQMAQPMPPGMVMVSAQQAAMMAAAAPAVPAPTPPGMQMVMVPQAMLQQQGLVMPGAQPMPMPPIAPPPMAPRPPLMIPGPRPPSQQPLPPNAVNTLYIEHLPNDVSKRELAHIFRHYEGYKGIRLVVKDSQKRAGEKIAMAFVEFTTVSQAALAMAKLQGYVFDLEDEAGFCMKLLYARPHSKPGTLRGPKNTGGKGK